jgi:hypothetical protein
MQKRAGLLFLSKKTKRVLLILENQKWTVPTFERSSSLFQDAELTLDSYAQGKIIPIELYLSDDKGFEYGTYICLIDLEFTTTSSKTIAWCDLKYLPKQLHNGLKTTLSNLLILSKIETILEIENFRNQE